MDNTLLHKLAVKKRGGPQFAHVVLIKVEAMNSSGKGLSFIQHPLQVLRKNTGLGLKCLHV